jgi:ABC-type glycerol-3-phosphate transport system permease component
MAKKSKMRRMTAGDYINTAILIFVGFLAVYPFLYVVALSLSDYQSVITGKVFLWPRGTNLEAYKMIMGDRRVTWGFSVSKKQSPMKLWFLPELSCLSKQSLWLR